MTNIKPISDLRNYTDVLSEVKEDSPVYLTRNGRGEFAILKLADYDKLKASIELLFYLSIGKKSARERSWISEEEAKVKLGL